MELCMAASKSPDAAMTKLDIVDVEDDKVNGSLARSITNLIVEVNQTKNTYSLVESVTNLKEVVNMKKSLETLPVKCANLREMARDPPPSPIKQMHLSDKFIKVNQQLSDFNLVVGDGLVTLPALSPRHDIGGQRSVTSPNTTVEKSRVKLYVSGLRPNHTEGQLRQHFSHYGNVTDCYIARDFKTDESRGFGFVTFREAAHATRALAYCPHFVEGGPVSVRPSNLETKAEKKIALSSAST
ncbi:DAZ-associated protein 1 [Taenia solium]|eukprot:TsM_001038600 transcript=TsM_001038600 gene=TsM_001038600